MKDFLLPIHRYFIPSFCWENEEILREYRIFINASLLTSLFALFYIFIAYYVGMKHSIGMLILSFIIFFISPWLIKANVKYEIVTNIYIFMVLISSVWHAYFDGGLVSAVLPWICIAPVTAILFNDKKNAWYWVVAAVLSVVLIAAWQLTGHDMQPEVYPDMKLEFIANSYVGLILIIFLLAVVFENAYQRSMNKLDQKNKEIEREKERSDDLLLNILPEEIADELKDKGYAEARQYDMVSVMFSDFVNFTTNTEKMSPKELVSELNYFFKSFDNIITKYKLEKIKTIGDSYLATAGMSEQPESSANDIVQAGLDMQEVVNERKIQRDNEGKPSFLMRIGIHTGPVVAGIVGVKKFAYDIWGDTVNTAARMEQTGAPGKVNISESTFQNIKAVFECEYRGEIEAKNKGKMKMYFIRDRKNAV